MLKGERTGSKHFRNTTALKTLGQHCRRLREQRGFSIDRLAKESEQLSSSVIHRLENGSGAVTVSSLFRYAEALGVGVRQLFDFETPPEEKPRLQLIASDDPKLGGEKFKTLLPVYSLRAAAGYFGSGEAVEPEGWIKAPGPNRLDPNMFVARAVGGSMLPKIHSEDFLVFRAHPVGSRQGKIVLAQYRGPADPETGGSYTVKQYHSSKVVSGTGEWVHKQVVLSPLNPEYEPIVLNPKDEHDFHIVAEYLFTIDAT